MIMVHSDSRRLFQERDHIALLLASEIKKIAVLTKV